MIRQGNHFTEHLGRGYVGIEDGRNAVISRGPQNGCRPFRPPHVDKNRAGCAMSCSGSQPGSLSSEGSVSGTTSLSPRVVDENCREGRPGAANPPDTIGTDQLAGQVLAKSCHR